MYINELGLLKTPNVSPQTHDLSKMTINNCGRQTVQDEFFLSAYHPPRYDMQLIYCKRGPIHCLDGDTYREIPEGGFMLYRPFEHRSFRYDRFTDVYWIHFHGDEFRRLADTMFGDEHILILPKPDTRIEDLFSHIIRHISFHNSDYQVFCCGLLMQIFGLIAERENSIDTDLRYRVIQPVISYIDAHFAEHVPTDTLAQIAHVSKAFLSRSFKRLTGNTPYEYQLSLCLRTASEYLEYTEKPICDIAASVGFEDPLAFCKSFKKKYGLSPKAYRNSIRNPAIEKERTNHDPVFASRVDNAQ